MVIYGYHQIYSYFFSSSIDDPLCTTRMVGYFMNELKNYILNEARNLPFNKRIWNYEYRIV